RGDKPLFILDVSVPPNVGPASWTEIEKTMPNVLRVDGSIVSIPDIDMNTVKIAGVAEGTIFSCWAEGMMHAGEREGQNHVGSIDPDYAKRVLRWMQRYAFQIAPPTNFGQIVPPNVFKRLRG
ncbi:MAG: hypothetical protein KGZ97_13695, partial [Bacteroidetes bacterium]|nr:hypothetical protein [Bacteroidota bacterium]